MASFCTSVAALPAAPVASQHQLRAERLSTRCLVANFQSLDVGRKSLGCDSARAVGQPSRTSLRAVPETVEIRAEAKPEAGSRVKIAKPVKVYHIPKVPEFDLEGQEGVVKEILNEWKGKPISANHPVKVAFQLEISGQKAKFFAHFREDEVEVL